MSQTLENYRLLGRSGLRVSPFALGTMTFGEAWGADADESRRMFDLYVDRGGNFIDTAGFYAQGRSEDLLGQFAAGKRDRLVLSTKYSLSLPTRDPNAGGNGRKSLMRSVETSLKRLATDHIDLLFLQDGDDPRRADGRDVGPSAARALAGKRHTASTQQRPRRLRKGRRPCGS